MKEVKALDDTTVRFTLEKPFAPFFTNLSTSYAGIISPAAVQKYGKDFGRNPVGTGPFKFETWIAGSSIVLARNADYQQFREDVLNKGPVHVAGHRAQGRARRRHPHRRHGDRGTRPHPPHPRVGDRFLNDNRVQDVVKKDALNFVFIEFNYKRPPFDNPKFRAALGWAVDKKSIVEGAWGGFATMNLNPIPVGVAGWDEKIGKQYGIGFDPRKAATMLDELGWRVNPATRVRESGGRAAKFTLLDVLGF